MQSFQETLRLYGIDRCLVNQFLRSMEMDLNQVEYDEDVYKEYILGFAEVVGLMCLHLFVDGNKGAYEKLRPYAMKLGSAFKKINFLRDIKDDYHLLVRTYFPDVDMSVFNNTIRAAIELDIENEFKEALLGIKKLPSSSKFGVFLAYKYYWSLLRRIKQIPAQRILNERIRIPNTQKLSLMMSSYVQYKIDLSRPFRIFGM
ncbi:squalene/phytoene synthase family protein [Sphingobacterium sp. JUb56]|uniref:phytoene/squalene synthase family protein n=1 Tax=Sphingobacterium sp. JUb56 TaxID=2587145 RepID=UPI0016149A23|nr:squalene/phytoene synthase family protein [Sphingobacterium sp. JUb56]MBB2954104.1 phytoene/squalene synthetase [Sphingobacterium sp. JUb56]